MGRRNKIIEEEPVMIEPKRQARFYISDGNYNPSGYRCGNVEIMRNKNESTEDLRARCRNAVEWTDTSTQHSFIPIHNQ